ncbi:MAG: MlaD family protein [Hyphomicrobiales bacterium]
MRKFKVSNQVIVGVLFILALAIFIWGFNFLKGQEVLRTQKLVYARYNKVNGLIASNPIYINGLQVGQIRSVYFDKNYSGSIIVELLIQNKFPIPKNSTAEIYSTDLLGSKAIQILLGDSHDHISNGDTLASNIERGLFDEFSIQVLPLKEKAEALMTSLDSMVYIFQSILNDTVQDNIRSSFGSVSNTLKSLEKTSKDISEVVNTEKHHFSNIVQNVESLTSTFKNNEEKISNIIDNLDKISDTVANSNLSGSLTDVRKSLKDLSHILNTVNKGEGTLGQLVDNDSLYIEMQKSLESLKLLIEDIKKNPKKYLKFSVF